MENSDFQIVIDQVEAIPINKGIYQKHFCRRRRKPAFIVGNDYILKFKITNIDKETFNGGLLIINVAWSNGQVVRMTFEIPKLEGEDFKEYTSKPTGILSPWFGLFKVVLETGPGKVYSTPFGSRRSAPTAPLYRNKDDVIDPELAFFSIYAQEIDEFHQYWAMIASVIAIWLLLLKYYKTGPA